MIPGCSRGQGWRSIAVGVLTFLAQAAIAAPAAAQVSTPGGISTANVTGLYALWSAITAAPGTGYVPGDQITPTNPTGTIVNSILGGAYAGAELYVAQTQVVSATVAAGGNSCSGSTATLTGTTGTGGAGYYFTATAPISGGAITNPVTITAGGVYTANPSILTAEPVTGSSCSGAELSVVMGVLTAGIQNPGSYSTISQGATAQQSATSGSGSGWQGILTFAVQSAYVLPTQNSQLAASASVVYKSFLNQCFGYQACNSVTTGIELTAFGWNALNANTSGGYNTAFGIAALALNTTSSNNAAFGRDACRYQTGGNNTCLGDGAGAGTSGSSTGTGNVFVGGSSGVAATTANYATCAGDVSCNSLTSGTNISAFGYGALKDVTSNSNNSAFGYNSGNVATGSNNSFFGSASGKSVTTGSNNDCFGYNVCATTLTTGTDNIIFGVNADGDVASGSTSNYFGVFGNSTTASISIAGTNSPTTATTIIHGSTFEIPDIANNTGAQTGTVCWASGGITYDNTNTCLASSKRFKKQIQPISEEKAKKLVAALNPVGFKYKDEVASPGQHFGLVAEQVAAIAPELASYDADGNPLKVKYLELIPWLTAALQEQQREIDRLKHASGHDRRLGPASERGAASAHHLKRYPHS